MNWITTNIRLPEDIYTELRSSAAKKRTSLAAEIRLRLKEHKVNRKKTNWPEAHLKDLRGKLFKNTKESDSYISSMRNWD